MSSRPPILGGVSVIYKYKDGRVVSPTSNVEHAKMFRKMIKNLSDEELLYVQHLISDRTTERTSRNRVLEEDQIRRSKELTKSDEEKMNELIKIVDKEETQKISGYSLHLDD